MSYKLEKLNEEDLRKWAIPHCQKKGHVQQVAFSTYHDCLTQICFNCEVIRTTIKIKPIPEYDDSLEVEI